MYTPPAFRIDDPSLLADIIRAARMATLVTATADGLVATHLPLIYSESDGPHGTLTGHLAKANDQWRRPSLGEALVIFAGLDAYVTPSWYETKRRTGKAVPTWNYSALHAYGPVEFFEDRDRLLDAVTRLTDLHEAGRSEAWKVADAPEAFIEAQLKGIVGVRIPISRIEGKVKMSQNRPLEDRIGVAAGLAASPDETDRRVAAMIPTDGS
jgi:Transcriptional regulator